MPKIPKSTSGENSEFKSDGSQLDRSNDNSHSDNGSNNSSNENTNSGSDKSNSQSGDHSDKGSNSHDGGSSSHGSTGGNDGGSSKFNLSGSKNPLAKGMDSYLKNGGDKKAAAKDIASDALKKAGSKAGKKAAMVGGKFGGEAAGAIYAQSKVSQALLNVWSSLTGAKAGGGFLASAGHLASQAAHTVVGAIKAGVGAVAHFATQAVSSIASIMSISAGAVGGTLSTVAVAGMLLGGSYFLNNTPKGGTDETCQVDTSSGLIDGAGNTDGHFFKKGTTSYKMGKKIATSLKKDGFNGIQIAAVLGNMAKENGTFDPDRNEKGGHGYVADDVGYGLFQFTNHPDFRSWMSKHGYKISDPGGQVEYFVHNLELNAFNTLKKKYKDDLKAASIYVTTNIEKPKLMNDAGEQNERYGYAQEAYKAFALKNVKGDNKTLAGATGDAGTNDEITSNNQDEECNDKSDSDAKDGTGAIKEQLQGGSLHWARGKEPADTKKYFHNPKKIGMALGSSTGWYNPGNQCVMLSSSYFHLIWSTSAKPFVDYGRNEPTKWASLMGGSASKTPHAGAIAGIRGGAAGVSTGNAASAGHTWIVDHVLKNGDIIGTEQNMVGTNGQGISGEQASETNTWNHFAMSKSYYQKYDVKFYTPNTKKHKLKWSK